jgi:pyruvate formate lyase activating enzyme
MASCGNAARVSAMRRNHEVGQMSELGTLTAGNRHDLHVGLSPDAPDEGDYRESPEGAFGYVHSYESSSRYDGPGLRLVLFLSGCLLRCSYCHNPDTWHLKDGTYVSAQQVIERLRVFAPALRSLDGGLTISGGEAMVQRAFAHRIFAGAKEMGLHTAMETSGYLGDRADDSFLSSLDLVLLDIKSGKPKTYKKVTGRDLEPTLRFAERLAEMGKPVWVRFTLVPGLTDDPENVARVARFVAPMKNVEWVEVQPFHQLGAFKWKAMQLDYQLADTPPASRELVERVLGQFRSAGCRAR